MLFACIRYIISSSLQVFLYSRKRISFRPLHNVFLMLNSQSRALLVSKATISAFYFTIKVLAFLCLLYLLVVLVAHLWDFIHFFEAVEEQFLVKGDLCFIVFSF